MADIYYNDKGICAYGTFKCSCCGEKIELTHDGFKERESEGEVVEICEGGCHILCHDCILDIAKNALNGKDLANELKVYPVMSAEEYEQREKIRNQVCREVIKVRLGISETDMQKIDRNNPDYSNLAGLIPIIGILLDIGLALHQVRKDDADKRTR